MAVHAYNPSTQKAKVELPWVQGQPGLHGETLSQKTEEEKKSNNNKK